MFYFWYLFSSLSTSFSSHCWHLNFGLSYMPPTRDSHISSTMRPSHLWSRCCLLCLEVASWSQMDQRHVAGLSPVICDPRPSPALPELSFLISPMTTVMPTSLGACWGFLSLTPAWHQNNGACSGGSAMTLVFVVPSPELGWKQENIKVDWLLWDCYVEKEKQLWYNRKSPWSGVTPLGLEHGFYLLWGPWASH